ncbi:probable tRNA N6-adenosine threonylcarbamoyltransferase, mitochondrial isoform X4 [Daucus carota subsp. sativus]|uniref:probable tRNA N6-adenosine threonylcarbamoyltransferase, mitochondrial isoform X4 n=1 Tax=Daucus carota subsp. sativus TaxID=79200 RepID=UPI00308297A0
MVTCISSLTCLTLLPKPLFNHINLIKNFTLLKNFKPQKSNFYSLMLSPKSLSSLSLHNCSDPKSYLQTPLASNDDLVILGIETSCDDTAAAVVRSNGDILSQVVSSQADLLAKYGGVAPKMAEEAHSQVIDQVVQEALDKAKLTESDLSAVAVTIGPGLSLCLRVGVQKARKLAGSHSLPLVNVHHMEAHALVVRLTEREVQFPFMALLISGGHNILILARELGQYLQLGTTIDDAIGEAYDKTAKWLGLDLRRSGGLAIEELAREGDAGSIKFKVPMKQHKDCNFSYAGLKTQVRLAIESKNIDAEIPISSASTEDQSSRADVAASFQRVAVLHLEEKCERAIEWALEMEPFMKHLVVSGGVASNQYVRDRLDQVAKKKGLQLVCPPPSLCTDNEKAIISKKGRKGQRMRCHMLQYHMSFCFFAICSELCIQDYQNRQIWC